MIVRRLVCGCPLLLILISSNLALAQPAPPPLPLTLTLESDPALGPGKIAVAKGITAARLARFAVEGLDVAQPVSVVVSTVDPARPIDVVVVKDSFDDPLQKATTGADGTATLQLRTHGDFGIGVRASDGTELPFMLAVWAGEITSPESAPFLAPVSNYDAATLAKLKSATAVAGDTAAAAPAATGGGLLTWLALAVGAIAAIGLLMVGVAMLRRKPQGGQ